MSAVIDRHLRFAIGVQARHNGELGMLGCLSSVKKRLGTSTFYFSNNNPNGRYKLILDDPCQREVTRCLLLINRRVNQKITTKQLFDRSQMGNQSCFRNEKINGVPFTWRKTWKLPANGVFEFDFVTLDQRPPS